MLGSAESGKVRLISREVIFQDSWALMREAQLSAGYTVNTYSKPPLYDASKRGNV